MQASSTSYDWSTPRPIDGQSHPIEFYLPREGRIPDRFKSGLMRADVDEEAQRWVDYGTRVFGVMSGMCPHFDITDATLREGIDQEAAQKHMEEVARTRQPRHEHKAAAMAWLLSMWCEFPEAPDAE